MADRQQDPPPSPYSPENEDQATGARGGVPPAYEPPEPATTRRGGAPAFLANWQGLVVPLLAIITALIIGGLIIWVTTGDFSKVTGAFGGLLQGSFGNPKNIANTLI